jgi:alpha-L-rhamnosidase
MASISYKLSPQEKTLMKPSFTFLCLAVLLLLAAPQTVSADLRPAQLRCEYRVDPLGVDVPRPRLSWILLSDQRGQRQTAYQVLVASDPQKLSGDVGDLWDSGWVESDESIQVAYAGSPLGSEKRCHWKVRVKDAAGKTCEWSRPALWSMGLLAPGDWKAQWIADAAAAARVLVAPHNGYHSEIAKTADVPKWVAIDLGKVQRIDAVRLHPARPYDWQPDTPGFLFPLRLKIEVAQKADFSDAKTVVDKTAEDLASPGAAAVAYRFDPSDARHVRLTATRLRQRDPGHFGLALAEMEVLSGEKNVARDGAVTSPDSIETGSWARKNLNDGRLLPVRGSDTAPLPPVMLRKEFPIEGRIARATVHVTARGLYELSINGRRVGYQLLAPEWTDYDRRIQVQKYDVTELVREGPNAIGAVLGDGWYAGRIGLAPAPGRYFYGTHTQLLMQLTVETADGRRQVVVSDGSWQSTGAGPIRSADILDGEVHELRQTIPGWDLPGFDAAAWKPVRAAPLDAVSLVWQRNEPIRVVQELAPVALTEPKPGAYVFDLGQNMVGWCRAKLRGPAGTKVTLRYAEVLNDDGTIYTANLRGAPQVDQCILSGRGDEVFDPKFTYHGFRYVEVTGLGERPKPADLTGRVICSSSPETGRFDSSNEMVNRLLKNILWTQRANMYSTPTDCPQRDERLGWMGDIQAFSQTAIFTMDMAGFFSKWVPDVRDAQHADGRYADFSPHPFHRDGKFYGVPAWGDAGVVVPWRMYVNYADRRMLEEHFESAARWIEFIRANNPDLVWRKARGNDYGDWLNGDTLILEGYPKGISEAPKDLLATAFFAHSTELVAKMAAALGRGDDAARYGKLFGEIKAALNREFVAEDGRIKKDTQAGYALALRFNLLDEPLRPKAVAHLLEAIGRYKDHPSTGIQSTHRMMLELSRNGRHDEACRLINLRSVPSWGYTIDMGATTIWERWDGYVKGRGYQNPGMNSFNHWAFGAVGEWIWRELVGINPDPSQPGYRHFVVRPRPGEGFTWVKGRYDSIRGRIVSDWRIEGGRFVLDVAIPPNTTATIYVPAAGAEAVTEGGKPAAQSDGVKLLRTEEGAAVFEVSSGKYTFSAPYAAKPRKS